MLTLYFTHHPDEEIRLKPYLARISSALNCLGINAIALPEAVNETTEVSLVEVDYEKARQKHNDNNLFFVRLIGQKREDSHPLPCYFAEIEISQDKGKFLRNLAEIMIEILNTLRWKL